MTATGYLISLLFNRNLLILLALLALLVCVLLKPVAGVKPVYSVQVTFDISQSMNVQDHLLDDAVVSRLSFAKQAARKLLESLPCGSQIGWSVFTGRRVVALLMPVEVCKHYGGLLTSLNLISSQMRWANASGIGKGLHQSIRAADEIGSDTQIIFITDGHEAPPLRSGQRGMPKTDKYSVGGLIAGVGGTLAVRIPKTDSATATATANSNKSGTVYWQADEVVQRSDVAAGTSHEELSRRQDMHLSKLGRLAKLSYLPLERIDQLAGFPADGMQSIDKSVSVDLRWIPAAMALLLLCLRFFPQLSVRDR